MELIDRNEVLRQMRDSRTDCPYEGQQAGAWKVAHDSCISIVESVAAIKAEPVRHGRWVKRGSRWQCTHCKVLMDIDGTPEENLLNYCTYCGTKMDGKEVNN